VLSNRQSLALLAPALVLFGLLLLLPLLLLIRLALLEPGPAAPLEGPPTAAAFAMLGDEYFAGILLRTVRIAGATTLVCLLLGYPLALSIARARPAWRLVQTLFVLSPLFVSVVVRAYGWTLLLGASGPIAALWTALPGTTGRPSLLGSEAAVIVGLSEALLPFMVLSLVAVLDRHDPALAEAARGLGASRVATFWHVTLPLSRPGAVAGGLLVFLVAMGSYATPALLGGSRVRVMATEIYTQVTSVFDWPLAAALSLVLLAVSVAVALVTLRHSAGPGTAGVA